MIGNHSLKAYIKLQGIIKIYSLAVCVFLGHLGLVVRGLHLDQLIVIFYTTITMWYNTALWIEKQEIKKVFKEAQA